MAHTKVRWFVDAIEEPIEQVGTPVDLRTDPDLFVALCETTHDEGMLHAAGVTCAIREQPDSSCSACPVSQHTASGGISDLCRLGHRQEVLLTTLAVTRCQRT